MPEVPAPESKSGPPRSVTNFGLNLVALASMLGALFIVRRHPFNLQNEVLVLLAAVALPVIVLDVIVLRVHRRESTGLDWSRRWSPDTGRVVTKLLGLALTLSLIALAYWAFPEYNQPKSFYDPFYALLFRFWRPLVVFAIAYVTIVDGLMREPRDVYWQLGRVVMGRFSDAKRDEIADHFRGWLVKAFFLPLMLVWMHDQVRDLVSFDFGGAGWQNLRLYDFLYTLVFGIDLLFTTCGYALSFRVIDAHLRWAEPTMLGWAVALFCYQPFFSLFERQYVQYQTGLVYGTWLAHVPTLRWMWAATILVLLAIYSLATVTFGVRFSNLTHRGILTNGPYRYTKHPAYISKNLSWWLISVPFVPTGSIWEAVRHSLLLGCVNFIYFMRARTEERHLSNDPAYVKYALWMNDHGMLAFLGRLIPALRYKAPASKPALGEPAPREEEEG
jgi:isoprenylcysteine carboxyl methyltransferase (ICMT) family protein YpbQ